MVVVTATGRAAGERTADRAALRSARLAELREGVWLRPDNLASACSDGAAGQHARASRPRPGATPAPLAASLWDLDGWAERADRLRQRLAATAPALAAGDTGVLAEGFVLSASVLRHFQADPLLPEPLLPRLAGRGLRAEYDEWDRAYRSVLAHYHP